MTAPPDKPKRWRMIAKIAAYALAAVLTGTIAVLILATGLSGPQAAGIVIRLAIAVICVLFAWFGFVFVQNASR